MWQDIEWAKTTTGHGSISAKFVFIMLAYHANGDKLSWPSQALLAEECGISVRTVQWSIRQLKERGFLSIAQKANQYGGMKYQLHPQAAASAGAPAIQSTRNLQRSTRKEQHEHPQGTTDAPAIPVGANLHEPTIEPTRKREPPKKVDEAFISRMVEKYLDIWPAVEVEERITEAMNHKASDKARDKQIYVQGWLRRDAEKVRSDDGRSGADTPEGYDETQKYIDYARSKGHAVE